METKRSVLKGVIAALLFGAVACTTTTRTVSPGPGAAVETTTVTTEPVDAPESEGILSATFDVIGEIISWPFRVVGAAFRAIF